MQKKLKKYQGQDLGHALGRAIAQRRKMCEYTQDDLAGMIGVDAETISRFERGVTLPSLNRLDNLATALGIGIAELLGQSSQIHSDQMTRLAEIMSHLEPAERALLLGIAELLVRQKST